MKECKGCPTKVESNVGLCSICASHSATKHDGDKPDLSLVPLELLEAAARAYMSGESKYGRYNFRNGGMEWHRLVAASLRHITAFNEGQDLDPETGNHHLGHAVACLGMLLVYIKQDLGKDTRYKSA